MRPLSACTALLAVIGLAACQPAAEGTESTDATAAEDAATPASTGSGGETIEASVREGLWQITMTANGSGSLSTRICMDAQSSAIDAGRGPTDASTENCTQTTNRTADGFEFSSRCDLGNGGVTETEGTMTGDMQTAYRMDATVTTTGSPIAAMNGTNTVVTEGAFQGACPEGWRPGDMELPGGLGRVNMNDMREQAAQSGG